MYTPNLFRGKKILITGGGTGLGRAMGAKLLSLGADIAICGRRKSVCEETAAELMAAHGGKVAAYGVDIRDAAAVDAMVEDIFAQGPLTGLINNAAGNFICPTEQLSSRGFDAIANIVMHGTFYVTQAVGKRWVAQGWKPGDAMRSVMSIIVTWVETGGPYVVPSAMSKSAIDAMTKSLAIEWARFGIRLVALAAGQFDTDTLRTKYPKEVVEAMPASVPLGRLGTEEEWAWLVAYLASPAGDFYSGTVITMDGARDDWFGRWPPGGLEQPPAEERRPKR